MSANQYLKRIGQSWYVRVKVPASLAGFYRGNTHVQKALHTRDLDAANRLKHGVVAAIKDEFERLRKVDPAHYEAHKLRAHIKAARARDDHIAVDAMIDHAAERAQELEHVTSLPHAKRWFDAATAEEPLLDELLDSWLSRAAYKRQTAQQHRHAYQQLREFLGGDTLAAHVTVDRATEYVGRHLTAGASSYNTQRRKLNSLVAFWEWLAMNGRVPRGVNPWKGFRLSKKTTDANRAEKRPYETAELVQLFAEQPAYSGLSDLCVLALFTGARQDELCSLLASDVATSDAGGWVVHIRRSKTKAGRRSIVVSHAHAASIFARRTEGKGGGELLFPEFRPGGYDAKLAWGASKAFGRFKRKRGLPADVDFHSFRRNFITMLENRGVDQVALARYVGHTRPTIAFQVYSGGSTEATNRKVAEAVAYPVEVEAAAARWVDLKAMSSKGAAR